MGIKLIFERNASTNQGYQEKLHCTYLHHTSLYSCRPHFTVQLYTTLYCKALHHPSLYNSTPHFTVHLYTILLYTVLHHTSLYCCTPHFTVQLKTRLPCRTVQYRPPVLLPSPSQYYLGCIQCPIPRDSSPNPPVPLNPPGLSPNPNVLMSNTGATSYRSKLESKKTTNSLLFYLISRKGPDPMTLSLKRTFCNFITRPHITVAIKFDKIYCLNLRQYARIGLKIFMKKKERSKQR